MKDLLGIDEFFNSLARQPIPTLLDEAAEQTTIRDVETHRAPIDDVIADMYEDWDGEGVEE